MDKSLAPGFARTTYTGITGVHHAILPVNIDPDSVPGSEPTFILKDASTALAHIAMGDFWDLASELMADGQHIGLCEIYKVDADTGEGTFLWGFDLARVGAVGGAGTALARLTLTWKLTSGGTGKVVILEGTQPVNLKIFPPYTPDSATANLSNYLVGDSSPFYGRTNSYPFAPISYTTKTDDATRDRAGLS